MRVCEECGESFDQGEFCPVDGNKLADASADALLGQTLGQYRVARLLGVGGMGRVYKAVHPSIGSRVAVKVLSRDCADSRDLVERFFSEARAANLIRHENIVNVLDLSTLPDGRPYIVMEFLDGVPLAEIMKQRGQLPLGSLARVAGEVLDALGAAHAKSIIHRDLKPDNIYISPHGRAKVLDFGIAKLMPEMSGRSAPTRTGSLLGTPHYMSPEQAMAKSVDARTDVWSMGVILYEGVTGEKPFRADSLFEVLRHVLETTPPPPRSLRPDLPPAYEELILRAIAKNPDERFQSAGELANALASATQMLPQEAWAPIAVTGGRVSARIGPPSMPSPSGAEPAPFQGYTPAGAATPLPTPANRDVTPHAFAPTIQASGKKSRVALWVGLALIAVGGIAGAAVLLSGNDEQTETEVAQTETGTAPATATGAAPAAEAAAGAGAGTGAAAGAGAAPEVPAEAPPAAIAVAENPPAKNPPAKNPPAKNPPAKNPPAKNPPVKNPPAVPAPAKTKVQEAVEPARKSGFDPAAFDVTRYQRTAQKLARRTYSDAVLVRIDAEGVRPNGIADLTLDDSFTVLYRFVSPSRNKRPDDLPMGVEHKPNCKFYVLVQSSGVNPYPLNGWTCEEPLIGIPKCSVKQVWKKAEALGAPSGNAVAEIGYWADSSGKGRWHFSVKGHYSGWIPDDC